MRYWALMVGVVGAYVLLGEAFLYALYRLGPFPTFNWWQPLIFIPLIPVMLVVDRWRQRRLKEAHQVECSIRAIGSPAPLDRWRRGQGVLASGRLTFVPGLRGAIVVPLAKGQYRITIPVESIIEPDTTSRRGISWAFRPVTLVLVGPANRHELRVDVRDLKRVLADLHPSSSDSR